MPTVFFIRQHTPMEPHNHPIFRFKKKSTLSQQLKENIKSKIL